MAQAGIHPDCQPLYDLLVSQGYRDEPGHYPRPNSCHCRTPAGLSPRSCLELLDKLQSDTLSVDSMVRIARNDSVIAAAILVAANGLRRLRAQPDTADLFAAASLIGTNKLKQIIVRVGLNKLLSEGSGQAFSTNIRWRWPSSPRSWRSWCPAYRRMRPMSRAFCTTSVSWPILSSMPKRIAEYATRPLVTVTCWRSRPRFRP